MNPAFQHVRREPFPRLNHAIADGYLVANVFRLLEQEIGGFVEL